MCDGLFQVLTVEAGCGQLLKTVDQSKVEVMEGVARKLLRVLTSQHYIIIETYMSIICLYSSGGLRPGRHVWTVLVLVYLE